MTRFSTTRRAFLRAVGAGFASFPLLRALENSVAHAAGESPPLRFITLYHPHGMAAETWRRRPEDSEANFSLSFSEPRSGALCALEPLERHKARLLIIDGLDLLSGAGGHDSAGTILTGSQVELSVARTRNSSLDQFLAIENGLGLGTRVASIELAVGNESAGTGDTLSYGLGGLPLPKILDPVHAFDRLFGGLVVGDDAVSNAAALRRQRQDKSLVDFLNADCRRLKSRLAPPEQLKLEQHMTALNELEKRLVPAPGTRTSCPVTPARPTSANFPNLKRYAGGEPYFDAITDAHIDLMALALACDVTRFGTLYMSDLSYEGNPLGLPADNHGSMTHLYDPSDGTHDSSGTPSTWALLTTFNRYCYGKIARLLDKLTEYGVVDSTLVYASSDMGNPALHSTRNVPTVLAGGLNGKFRMGRRVQLQGASNNHLLVSIAQAFGVAIDGFGSQPNPADAHGPLSGLT